AEGEGFEPPVPFRVQRFSRPPPSTTRPSLRTGICAYASGGPQDLTTAWPNDRRSTEREGGPPYAKAVGNLVSGRRAGGIGHGPIFPGSGNRFGLAKNFLVGPTDEGPVAEDAPGDLEAERQSDR